MEAMVGGRVRLLCLLLTLITPAALSCGEEDLVDCAQQPSEACLCLRVATPTGVINTLRTCTASPYEINYAGFRVREVEPGAFRFFPDLVSLNLSGNSPPELNLSSQSFVGLDSLTSLDLQSDGLNALPDCLFAPLPSLETLYLQNNNLSQLNLDAFGENMSNLHTLYLDNNRLTELPIDLLQRLPALTSISLSSNMWDCSSPSVTVLVNLVHSDLVQNGDQLRCANSTLVSYINIPAVTPTPTLATPTPRSTPMTTPLPVPQVCSRLENSGSEFGFFDWPETATGERVERACPHGPPGGVVSRECGEMGEWGPVEGGGCADVSDTTRKLLEISQEEITELNVEAVSLSLSTALSSPSSSSSPLSPDEVEVVLDVVEQLISFPMASLNVLNYSLQAVDHLLNSSGDSVLTTGTGTANRLRFLVDTALLSFLSANNTHLVLTFSHLAVGGVFLSGTNHTHIVAVITTGEEGVGGVVIGEERGGGGDVEVVIDGDLEGPIQVTVYNDTGIFNTTSCGKNEGLKGDNDLAPVISVSDESATGSESVTITYHTMRGEGSDGEPVCVRWNSSLNCGSGGWETAGCHLTHISGSDLTCLCRDSGTFAVLDIPRTVVESGSARTPGVVKYVFYCCCALAALLYLPVILAVLFNRSLRVLPLKQCLANIGVSQVLSLLVTAASYHPHQPHQLCSTLAVLQHYTALVALVWLAVYPVMVSLKVFRRTWFERCWLLTPVAVASWVLPAVIVGGVAASRYRGFTDSTDICWMEGDMFPNYFTYISAVVMVITLSLSIFSLIILCCSDYDLELPVHLRIISNQVTALLYSLSLISLFLTADSVHHTTRYLLDTDKFLILVAVLAVLTGLYFLLANGCANGHIRSALLCQEDPVLKRKISHYHQDQGSDNTLSSQASSRTSQHRNHRRRGTRLTDEMNLNYVDSYLGYDEGPSSSHVPLDVLGRGGGRGQGRVKERRSGSESLGGPTGFRQVGVNIPHTTSMT